MSLTSGRRELLFRESIHIILAPRRRGAPAAILVAADGMEESRRRLLLVLDRLLSQPTAVSQQSLAFRRAIEMSLKWTFFHQLPILY
jgi:hypothetical protein